MNHINQGLGVLMLDLMGLDLAPEEQELLQRKSVGGLVLFSRNYASPNQLEDLIAAIRKCNQNLIIAVDQEGGRVQRFREGFQTLPALRKIGLRYEQDREQGLQAARQCGWAMAAEILHYGIDLSFAPVLDLFNVDSQVIAERAFAADADQVIELGKAYIDGMHEAGMVATGKHFPGHGTVLADSHKELPRDTRSIEEIRATDFKVFASCAASLDAVMPAHVIYPAVDEACAGFSSIWIQSMLREELGFDGVVFSDDLSMNAAHSVGSVKQRAELALGAGCDMVMLCNDRDNAVVLADWLDGVNYPANVRLDRLRGKPGAGQSNLFTTKQWLEASDTVSSLLD